jgi:PAS domain S-box-containing protein
MPLEDTGSYEPVKRGDLPNIRLSYLVGAIIFIIVLVANFYIEDIDLRLNGIIGVRNLRIILLFSLILLVILETVFIFLPLEKKIRERDADLVKQIEERRAAESKLRRTEYIYKLLATNLPNLSLLLFDKNLKFILADGPFLKRSGFDKEKVEGKFAVEIIGEDRYPLFEGHYKGALEGRSVSFNGYSAAGFYYHTQIVPTYNRLGEITGGMVVTEDISEKHKVESELTEMQNRFSQLSENLKSGFWLTSADGQEILYINQTVSKIYDRELDDLYKNPMSFRLNIHPDDIAITQKDRFERILNNKYNVEYRILGKDGAIRWVWSRAFPVKDNNGEMVRIAGIIEDITDRKNLEDKAVQLEVNKKTIKLLSNFIRDTAHDLRTPLTIINTSSYLLGKISDKDEQLKHIDMIKKQVLRLTVTIDQLHSMSNIDAMDRLDSSPIKINHLIKTIKRDLEPKAKQKNINLSYSLLEGNYIIPGDEDYLFKAISGICENAIIYTNDNGLVEITTLKQDNNLVIEVKDNGIGIDESDLEKIFDRFYKVNKARTSNSSATGLGLTMAKLIIEKHGGKITVESKIGVGSTFKIYLPIETVTS